MRDFDDRLLQLEQAFKSEAERERTVFLPNIWPIGPVDFIFICMEPSFGGWAKTKEEANAKIKQGFKNFSLSARDGILHYCIREYLCASGKRYYITDLSKGAMYVNKANDRRPERYERWFSLLTKELELFSKDSTQLVAVGKRVKDTLEKNGMKNFVCIPHYSAQAVKYHKQYIIDKRPEFDKFKIQISKEPVLKVAHAVVKEAGMNESLASNILNRLEKKHDLTESEKILIFIYKNEFNQFPYLNV